MFNPLVDNFNQLNDSEVEDKLTELARKYWMTRNPEVQQQITVLMDMYKIELTTRRAIQQQKQKDQDNGENSLDNLINIS
jgi:L-arabinose isomerase|tara:strand:+ start:476 stop:715 length:240 start_codon:yes stop_codon:yes gene_type:complete